jgi:hypothetical protein
MLMSRKRCLFKKACTLATSIHWLRYFSTVVLMASSVGGTGTFRSGSDITRWATLDPDQKHTSEFVQLPSEQVTSWATLDPDQKHSSEFVQLPPEQIVLLKHP